MEGEVIDSKDSKPKVVKPTMRLRWHPTANPSDIVKANLELQQAWEDLRTGEITWIQIPIE